MRFLNAGNEYSILIYLIIIILCLTLFSVSSIQKGMVLAFPSARTHLMTLKILHPIWSLMWMFKISQCYCIWGKKAALEIVWKSKIALVDVYGDQSGGLLKLFRTENHVMQKAQLNTRSNNCAFLPWFPCFWELSFTCSNWTIYLLTTNICFKTSPFKIHFKFDTRQQCIHQY